MTATVRGGGQGERSTTLARSTTSHAAFQNADVGFSAHALDDIHHLARRLLSQPVRAQPALRARDGHAGAEAGVEVELVQQFGLVLCQLLRAKLRLELLQSGTI